MNKLATVGIAAALAATLATTASAAPHRPFRHYNPPIHRHGGWNPAPFVAGTILGLGAIAAINAANSAPVYAVPAGPDPHVDWCYRAYPNSYDVTTNTFIGQDGRRYYCDSPYN
jgi:hypothetical protein